MSAVSFEEVEMRSSNIFLRSSVHAMIKPGSISIASVKLAASTLISSAACTTSLNLVNSQTWVRHGWKSSCEGFKDFKYDLYRGSTIWIRLLMRSSRSLARRSVFLPSTTGSRMGWTRFQTGAEYEIVSHKMCLISYFVQSALHHELLLYGIRAC